MVYVDQFVAVVKCGGKILREDNNVVTIPFSSEYSILLKNLGSKRASVKVSIDGEDVLNGSSVVVEPNKPFELKGFLKDYSVKNKFKFIKKTQDVVDHIGDKIDDGIIRIEYAFEKEVKLYDDNFYIIHDHHHHYDYHPLDWAHRRIHGLPEWGGGGTFTCNTNLNISQNLSSLNNASKGFEENITCSAFNINSIDELSKPNEDEGITVKGSQMNQKMGWTTMGEMEPSKIITLKLRGVQGKKVASKPITVKTKIECETCGKKNKSNHKFCSSCGTSLR